LTTFVVADVSVCFYYVIRLRNDTSLLNSWYFCFLPDSLNVYNHIANCIRLPHLVGKEIDLQNNDTNCSQWLSTNMQTLAVLRQY